MQRHEMMTAMADLGLKGMAGAFDEAVTTGLQRKRTTMEILTDLLRAEATHRHAASIRYRMSAARLPAVKDLDAFVFDGTPINEGLVRLLHSGSFITGQRNIVLVGGTGTGKTHLATAITANVVRAGARGRYFNTVDLVNRLEEETRLGKAGTLAAQLSRLEVVVLDELGYLPFARSGGQLLFHLVSKLYERTSVTVTTNLAFGEWPTVFGDRNARLREGHRYRAEHPAKCFHGMVRRAASGSFNLHGLLKASRPNPETPSADAPPHDVMSDGLPTMASLTTALLFRTLSLMENPA